MRECFYTVNSTAVDIFSVLPQYEHACGHPQSPAYCVWQKGHSRCVSKLCSLPHLDEIIYLPSLKCNRGNDVSQGPERKFCLQRQKSSVGRIFQPHPQVRRRNVMFWFWQYCHKQWGSSLSKNQLTVQKEASSKNQMLSSLLENKGSMCLVLQVTRTAPAWVSSIQRVSFPRAIRDSSDKVCGYENPLPQRNK